MNFCRSIILLLMMTGWFALPVSGADAQAVDFKRDIQPIFVEHCIKCHGPDKQKGKFRLDQRTSLINGGGSGEPAIVLGKSGESHLINLVTEAIEDEVMPPKGKAVTDQQVAKLKAWIDQGAIWPGQMTDNKGDIEGLDHWSFQSVKRPTLPTVESSNGNKAANAIDTFIFARLQKAGLHASDKAQRRTLIRRAYFIVIGLPPTPQAVEEFVNDDSPKAYEQLIDRLLASPQYGERWARHWLDIARFAETNGFETNTPRPNAWRYRDYVIDAFNKDKPYDQFIKEQLVGDKLGADVATGFIVGGAYDQVKSPDINLTLMQRNDELHDMVNTTSTAFIGLTVACARCHNHKFDPISQKDYYAFQAVFAGVNHGDRAISIGSTKEAQAQIASLRSENAKHEAALNQFAPSPVDGPLPHTVVIDDESVGQNPGVQLLATKRGHGTNPDGTSRGHKDDPGDVDRMPNVSGGRYTYWETGIENKDLLAYRPAVEGRYRVWLSWGCGWNTHQSAVPYYLDHDGNPDTRDDQKQIAIIDQKGHADGTKEPVGKPLWSGLRDVGTFEFGKNSCIIVRSGDSGNAVTADAIVLQAEQSEPNKSVASFEHPRLRSAVNSKSNEERFPPIEAKYVRFNIYATNGGEPCIDELAIFSSGDAPRNVALASAGGTPTSSGNFPNNPIHKLEHINDGQYGNARSWISNANGKGWVQIELKAQTSIDRITWGRDRNTQYADRTATQFRIDVATEVDGKPGPWRTVATSEGRLLGGMMVDAAPVYRFAGLTKEQAKQAVKHHEAIKANNAQLAVLTKPVMAYAGNFTQPKLTHRLYRGDPLQPRDVVAPGAVTALNGDLQLKPDEPQQQRRTALANWIANKDNPLTARVMANRLWQHHFGEGLVNTPSDFGHMGAEPSHPQLLDWLASEFMEHDWSVKHIQKLILMSHTWQQASLPNAAAAKIDADSILLWRFPPRRLEAEAIRDATLFVAGTLDTSMGGPGFDVFKPNGNYVRFYAPKDTFGPAEWRRMIYMYKVRMEQDATFGVFDCPDAGQVVASRSRSTTALQALNLLNSNFVLQQAQLMSERLTKASNTPASQVRNAFSLTFGRPPSDDEVQRSVALIREHGLDAFCRAMLNANEFLFVQ